MNDVIEIVRMFIPLIVVQLLLMIVALIDLYRRNYVRGEKWVWVIIIIVINLLGPIAYFIFGRKKSNEY
ncbi:MULTISPECIES: PLDc N-terminal domain-containing protein [Shouchella]|uniref:PLDc N-terminal domain-containing protein n=2 Tax=Shouchella TaxID=2893057 RepID=A0ABY7W123_9BACI|nr:MULTISPECIES: PLDc N-terminal domain-containing protein [Shouchella]MED4127673.1 PLDc N-terminal domain-containing protein [Shouchella miscanthi]WDF02642.1 PLDc N-terminal domain-containing protein [Shouchella hunanensis]